MDYVVIRRTPAVEASEGFPADPEVHAYGPLYEQAASEFAARLRDVTRGAVVEVLPLESAHEVE